MLDMAATTTILCPHLTAGTSCDQATIEKATLLLWPGNSFVSPRRKEAWVYLT